MVMIRLLLAAFFVGHGLVHGIMFALPYSAQAAADLPFNPSHSWLIGDTRAFAFVVALAVTVAFVLAGAGYVGHAGWWPLATIAAAGLSLLLLALYLSKWWTVGLVISVVLAIAAWRVWTAA
jgi:hypothetical protein